MDQNLLKINLLAIMGFGLLVTIVGLLLYLLRDSITDVVRFLLPIPPLSVAAYVFIINVFRQYGGKIPPTPAEIARELFVGTLVAALVFGLLSLGLMFFLEYARRYFL
ncbi:MAG: hypothetical protein H6636_13385 [Anaerolineales bacterium]|nr:hypothetical protein [Anaerolineales bacterium]